MSANDRESARDSTEAPADAAKPLDTGVWKIVNESIERYDDEVREFAREMERW